MREFPLAPVSPLIGGTGVPGYRTSQFTGNATYEIPLKVPAGINGFEPELVLRYNVNTTDSWLGKGWDLTLGRVTRSQRKKPMDFTDEDTFVLELGDIHDELIKLPNSGTQYQTLYKKRSFYIIKTSSGWLVKDGTGMTYAFTVKDQPEGAPGVWAWLLREITDAHGNRIEIQYQEQDGWQFPRRIIYSNREIFFRSGSTDKNEFYPKYFKHGKSHMKYFLRQIEMFANGALFKKYEFGYRAIGGFKNDFLSSVDEIGSDGAVKRIATMDLKPIESTAETHCALSLREIFPHRRSGLVTTLSGWGKSTETEFLTCFIQSSVTESVIGSEPRMDGQVRRLYGLTEDRATLVLAAFTSSLLT